MQIFEVDLKTETEKIGGFDVHYRPSSIDFNIFDNSYHENRFFPENFSLPPSPVVLDVGAHIGVFSLLVLAQDPDATIHAIEAGAENLAIFGRTVADNAIEDKVFLHHLALSDKSGVVKLEHAEASWGHKLTIEESDSHQESVSSVTLSTFLDDHVKGVDVDFMKMNIEGSEYPTFLSSPPEVIRRIKSMSIELHPTDNSTIKAFLKHIEEAGFVVEVTLTDHPDVHGWMHATQS